VQATHPMQDAGPILLFDGVCNLCNSSVQFIIRHDPQSKFRFAALQSDFGVALLRKHGLTPGKPDSILLIKGDRHYQRSNAALEISKDLSGLWPALYIFKIIPLFLRDALYDLMAKYRYKFFGTRDECLIPTPELKARFLG
jgi:predicted DCC family thiol-disulfide oxidoreductase YuxK